MIASANVIIADLTSKESNVFYELGLAHSLAIDVILITQDLSDVPFDVAQFRVIAYENTFAGAETLIRDLSKMLTRVKAEEELTPSDEEARELIRASDRYGRHEDVPQILQIKAELARREGRLQEAQSLLIRALRLAREGAGSAGEIGNAAMEAEACKFNDMARDLYQIALERDPSHVNNRQSFVSFILDELPDDAEMLKVAEKLLGELEATTERQARTRALYAQFLMNPRIRATRSAEEIERSLSELTSETRFHSLRDAAATLAILMRANRRDQVRQVLAGIRDSAATEEEIIACDRVLADALAVSEDIDEKNEAVQIYESLIERGDNSPELKHNLATLLAMIDSTGNASRATKLWEDAIKDNPEDGRILSAFAHFLMQQGKQEDAQRLLSAPAHVGGRLKEKQA